jgi:hypothetical protein
MQGEVEEKKNAKQGGIGDRKILRKSKLINITKSLNYFN